MADSRDLRDLATDLWHKLMVARPKVVEELLVCRTAKGEQYDVKTRGFDLLLQREQAAFSSWLGDHHAAVRAVMADAPARAWTAAQQAERARKVDQLRQLKQRREQRQVLVQKQTSQAFLLRKQLREHISSQLFAVKEAELARWRKQRIEDVDRDRFAYAAPRLRRTPSPLTLVSPTLTRHPPPLGTCSGRACGRSCWRSAVCGPRTRWSRA